MRNLIARGLAVALALHARGTSEAADPPRKADGDRENTIESLRDTWHGISPAGAWVFLFDLRQNSGNATIQGYVEESLKRSQK
jgi:hypothetical protein